MDHVKKMINHRETCVNHISIGSVEKKCIHANPTVTGGKFENVGSLMITIADCSRDGSLICLSALDTYFKQMLQCHFPNKKLRYFMFITHANAWGRLTSRAHNSSEECDDKMLRLSHLSTLRRE